MRYVSTRGKAPPSPFCDSLLRGLASDGGLAMPEAWPRPGGVAGKSYADAAHAVLSLFADTDNLRADIGAAYAGFGDPAIAPLVEFGNGRYLLELFHGPTFAFKDIAMQVLARMFARALAARGGRATILAATSGDTGSAAIAAFGGLAQVDLFVLHPKGRISEVQRRQMTTADFANVHNIALEGTFDDGQSIVKALFADAAFVAETALTAVNSINFARIAAQIVYYFTAAAHLKAPPVFVVPTGNFGDVFAGEAAMRMGLAAKGLVVATNANDILARALDTGVYEPGEARLTLSPSMDIQVASNFERALFEASGRDADWTSAAMAAFARTRRLVVPARVLGNLRARYSAHAVGDSETLDVIARVHRRHGRLIDPHTAVAWAAADRLDTEAPVVVLSTAHPAKFPGAVEKACGVAPEMPGRLREVFVRRERFDVLPPDTSAVRDYIRARVQKP
ncbi:MAG TPA: threonine synthase [Rhizomicrobium sp.]|nr:threonine synthase [Rhizomicrobium sp.]